MHACLALAAGEGTVDLPSVLQGLMLQCRDTAFPTAVHSSICCDGFQVS